MRYMHLFLTIIFALMVSFNAYPKFYIIEVNNKYRQNRMDSSSGKFVTETIKTPANNYKSNNRRAAKINEDRSLANEKNETSSPIAPDAISNKTKAFLDKINKKSRGYKMMEGDMILNRNQQKTFGNNSLSKDYEDLNQARVGYQWPNNKMYYTFDATVEENFRNLIRSAVNELAEILTGCVEIKEGVSDNYIIVSAENTGQCQGMVGVNKEMKNTLNLDPSVCTIKQTIQHEFIHGLGIYHQQSRKDRDQYVNINFNNIITAPTNMKYNFQIQEDSDTYNLPYDYDSIMHYRQNDFSKNGVPTIETKNPANQERIGKQASISPGDVKLIKAFYGCQEDQPELRGQPLPGQPQPPSGQPLPGCKTVTKKSCVFPFTYKGKTHNKCTNTDSNNGAVWCATNVDKNGEVIRNTWEDCDKGCPGTGS